MNPDTLYSLIQDNLDHGLTKAMDADTFAREGKFSASLLDRDLALEHLGKAGALMELGKREGWIARADYLALTKQKVTLASMISKSRMRLVRDNT